MNPRRNPRRHATAVGLISLLLLFCAVGNASEPGEVIRAFEFPQFDPPSSDSATKGNRTPPSDLAYQLATFEATLPTPQPKLLGEKQALPNGTVAQLHRIASNAHTDHALGRLLTHCNRALWLDSELSHAEQSVVRRLAAWALSERGRLRLAQGDRSAGRDDFSRALSFDPHCQAALCQRAVLLAQAGKHTQALEDFSRAIADDKNNPRTLRNRAALFLAIDQPEQAMADCRRAMSLCEQDASGTNHLRASLLELRGTALRQAGDPQGASKDYSAAMRLRPNHAALLMRRGTLFAEVGHYDQAISDLLKAVETDPSSSEAYRCLAWLLATCPEARLRNTEAAVESARRSRKLANQDDPRLLEASAAAHASAGQFGQAISLQQLALLAADESTDMAEAEARLTRYRQGKPHIALDPRTRKEPGPSKR